MAIRFDFRQRPEDRERKQRRLQAEAVDSMIRRAHAPRQLESSQPTRGCLRNSCSHYGWGGWIRTTECRLQRPMPYHLATPHRSGMAENLLRVSPIPAL